MGLAMKQGARTSSAMGVKLEVEEKNRWIMSQSSSRANDLMPKECNGFRRYLDSIK